MWERIGDLGLFMRVGLLMLIEEDWRPFGMEDLI
jgi:hypothetical protein